VETALKRFPLGLRLATSMEVCRETADSVKIGKKYLALYIKTQVPVIVTGDISHHKGVDFK
jgi:hypothetical protein